MLRAMENRRALFRALLAAGLAATAPAPSATAAMVRKQPLSGAFDGLEANFIEVTYEPGKDSAPHRHAGLCWATY